MTRTNKVEVDTATGVMSIEGVVARRSESKATWLVSAWGLCRTFGGNVGEVEVQAPCVRGLGLLVGHACGFGLLNDRHHS
jgi:hypothetical protein